jgi:hypothetical protein
VKAMDDRERARRREVIAAARDTIARCQKSESQRRSEEQLGIRRRMWNPGDEPDAMERWRAGRTVERSLPRQEQEEERKSSTSSEMDAATAQRWNEWADGRIWEAIGDAADVIGGEIAEIERPLIDRIDRLERQVSELRAELRKAASPVPVLEMSRLP